MITLVGGTFNRFHKGHEKLLFAAYKTGNKIMVGVTSDQYAKAHKEKILSYKSRVNSVEKFMSKFTGNYEIHPLDSMFGNTLDVDEAEIVVSPETYTAAKRINEKRIAMGKKALNVVEVPFSLAEDLFPISSTRIINREITRTGKRIKTINIAISTGNNLKVAAVDEFIHTIMKNYKITVNTDYKTGSEQPFGEETMKYATDRAMYGLKDNDYSIGIESGIFYNKVNDMYYDLHYCAVIDRYSVITTGFGSGFQMPDSVIDAIKTGSSTNEYVENLFGIKKIGHSRGISGLISSDSVTRSMLIYEALRNAFIPRFRPDIYERDFLS
ncbi:pantetheine-phosphate adenylyltransferase [Ferroplasma sp.]|uniref:pantetheine-phosphate adenylyltransferase n=1 Tax=Ferroplasma sp. TaxID=2591003 RepID=UPI00307EE0F1